jgi:hypothetical protein
MGSGLIQIVSAADKGWMLRIAENAKVQVTGKAKKDVLRVGSFVSFVADVDRKRAQVQDKVGKLTLFTPSEQRTLGAFPEGTYEDAEGDSPFDEDSTEEDDSAEKPDQDKDAGAMVERFEIAGRIAKINRTGTLTVYAPNRYFKPTVEIELTEEPDIGLDLLGPMALSVVKPGDKVRCRAKLVGPNLAQVSDLTVELAEPLTMGQPKKPTRRAARSSRSRRAKAEESDEAEEKKDEADSDDG